jgi:hypothetical protein
MSENNNLELEQVALEPEVVEPMPFDFEFMTFALGLVPICNGEAAISLGNIASLSKTEDGAEWLLTLINDEEFELSNDDMVTLERLLKDRKARRKDTIKDELSAQLHAQAEMQGGVQPGMIVGAVPAGKRFRQ